MTDACFLGFESHQGEATHQKLRFGGAIDDVLVFNRAVTVTEVAIHAARPRSPVTYRIAAMTPRSDGIVLGATEEPGIWTLDVDQTAQRRIIERQAAIFNAMRAPLPGVPITGLESAIRCAP